jgi:major membrane immunogen (membrane-anchored lipoprotein)
MLVQNGQLDGIDSISGATINYREFKEAVEAALKEAEEK